MGTSYKGSEQGASSGSPAMCLRAAAETGTSVLHPKPWRGSSSSRWGTSTSKYHQTNERKKAEKFFLQQLKFSSNGRTQIPHFASSRPLTPIITARITYQRQIFLSWCPPTWSTNGSFQSERSFCLKEGERGGGDAGRAPVGLNTLLWSSSHAATGRE